MYVEILSFEVWGYGMWDVGCGILGLEMVLVGRGGSMFLLVSFLGTCMMLEKFVFVILWCFHGLYRGLFEE